MKPSDRLREVAEEQAAGLPELTIDEYRAITAQFRLWVQLMAERENVALTDEQRAVLRQLDPDIWHSSLLYRLLFERKPALPEPPPLRHAYPDYEASPDVAESSCGSIEPDPPPPTSHPLG